MATDYLRNRPFLLVKMVTVPRPDADTRVKGWMNDPKNIRLMEQVSIVDRINSGHWASNVIIDIVNAKMIQNKTTVPDDQVMSDYIGRYETKITEALKVWAYQEVSKHKDAIESEQTEDEEA